jgi:protein-S-isoprenylcysteine O-methyltransferase Ste14
MWCGHLWPPALSMEFLHDPWRIALLVVALATVALRAFFHVRAGTHKEPVVSSTEGRRSGIVRTTLGFSARFIVVIWCLAPQALGFADLTAPLALRITGVVVGVLGVVMLAWVHITLGRAFSPTLVVRENAPLVQSGPYARIRHPMYTAFAMVVVGATLVSANVVVGGLSVAAVLYVMIVRTPKEEAMMRNAHGATWDEYVTRTRKFL